MGGGGIKGGAHFRTSLHASGARITALSNSGRFRTSLLASDARIIAPLNVWRFAKEAQ